MAAAPILARSRLWVASAALLVVLTFVAAGCGGSHRSTKAFCGVITKYQHHFADLGRQANQQSQSGNPIKATLTIFGSFGELESFLNDLDKASPSDIEPDVATAQGDVHYIVGHVGSEATSIGGFLLGGFRLARHEGSYRKIDAYASQNCNASIFNS